MDPRTRIPTLALLGLSCTDCSERGAVPEPIVGEWRSVDIDAFPMVRDDEDALRVGWGLEVGEGLRGRLAYYYEEEDDEGVIARGESYSDLMLAVEDATRCRIAGDPTGRDGHDDGPTPPDGGYGELASDESESDSTAGYTAGALDLDERSFDEFELELRDAAILDRELAAEVLTCARPSDGDDERRA